MVFSTSLDALAFNLRIAAITPRFYPRCVSPVPSASSLIPACRVQRGKERSVGRSDLPQDHENPSAYQARLANLQRARRIRREKRAAEQMKLFRGES